MRSSSDWLSQQLAAACTLRCLHCLPGTRRSCGQALHAHGETACTPCSEGPICASEGPGLGLGDSKCALPAPGKGVGRREMDGRMGMASLVGPGQRRRGCTQRWRLQPPPAAHLGAWRAAEPCILTVRIAGCCHSLAMR